VWVATVFRDCSGRRCEVPVVFRAELGGVVASVKKKVGYSQLEVVF